MTFGAGRGRQPQQIERSARICDDLEKILRLLDDGCAGHVDDLKPGAGRPVVPLSVSLLRRPSDLWNGPRAAAQAMGFAARRSGSRIGEVQQGVYLPPGPVEPWFLDRQPQPRRPSITCSRWCARRWSAGPGAMSGGGGAAPLELLRDGWAIAAESALCRGGRERHARASDLAGNPDRGLPTAAGSGRVTGFAPVASRAA